MFNITRAYNGFAVPDIQQAREFYGEKVGMDTEVISEEMGLLQLKLGDRETLVYVKPDHQPANYTILNFVVDDVDAAVDELTSRGVTMEVYEGFEQDEKGIARANDGGPDIAWFTDPAGNILSVHADM
jgi:predicted enzyme related to lactoylglutathione lyase